MFMDLTIIILFSVYCAYTDQYELLKAERLCCESLDQALIYILCRPKDQYYSSSIFRGGQTLKG